MSSDIGPRVRGVPPWWYTFAMASSHPRVQVTLDPELAAAMEAVDPQPASRSRLIRDLAIRGAEAEQAARSQREAAVEYLLTIVRGETDYDFGAARAIHAEREAGRA
jgi:metal-responsive CopG/Arc/MetJ family transcriptional regulator